MIPAQLIGLGIVKETLFPIAPGKAFVASTHILVFDQRLTIFAILVLLVQRIECIDHAQGDSRCGDQQGDTLPERRARALA